MGQQGHAFTRDAQAVQEPYEFRFVAAPADLDPFLNSLYVWRTHVPLLQDVLPAYSGQLVAFVEGRGTMRHLDGRVDCTNDGFVVAPLLRAEPFAIEGPAYAFGVSLNFRGWAALTGLDVTKWNGRMFPAEQIIGETLARRFAALAPELRAGRIGEAQMLAAMADIVRDGLRPLPEKQAKLIDRTLEWLSSSFNPELDALYAALPYSERQIQRLVARFFGQPPIRLVRRYRAVRAATLLAMPQLDPTLEREIREAFSTRRI